MIANLKRWLFCKMPDRVQRAVLLDRHTRYLLRARALGEPWINFKDWCFAPDLERLFPE